MEALDNYLNSLDKKENKKVISKCCDNELNIYETDEWNVCVECGKIVDTMIEKAPYKENISFILKTFIPMSYKNSNLVRLHKWINYSYYEVRNHNLVKFIETLNIKEKEVIDLSKIIFIQEFNKVRIRAKVKMGLVCYAIFKAHIILKKPIDLDNLLKMLDITEKHYNSAVKKIEEDKLYYPKNLNKYLEMIDYQIDKNVLIRSYNSFMENNSNFNGKTILLSFIYYYLDKQNKLNHKTFFKHFGISQNSVNSVIKLIKEDDLF